MKKNRNLESALLGTLLLAGFSSQSAFAFPLPAAQERTAKKQPPSQQALTESGVDFTAIVALSNCSGSLIQFTNSQPQDNALILTNGHCYEGGFLKPGQVITNKASSRSFDLLNATGKGKLATFKRKNCFMPP